jgi:hypothetical protein
MDIAAELATCRAAGYLRHLTCVTQEKKEKSGVRLEFATRPYRLTLHLSHDFPDERAWATLRTYPPPLHGYVEPRELAREIEAYLPGQVAQVPAVDALLQSWDHGDVCLTRFLETLNACLVCQGFETPLL